MRWVSLIVGFRGVLIRSFGLRDVVPHGEHFGVRSVEFMQHRTKHVEIMRGVNENVQYPFRKLCVGHNICIVPFGLFPNLLQYGEPRKVRGIFVKDADPKTDFDAGRGDPHQSHNLETWPKVGCRLKDWFFFRSCTRECVSREISNDRTAIMKAIRYVESVGTRTKHSVVTCRRLACPNARGGMNGKALFLTRSCLVRLWTKYPAPAYAADVLDGSDSDKRDILTNFR